jgi:hypothetical protein
MNPSKKFLEITTYKELEEYVAAFQKKEIGLMIIVSRAGLGKTTLVEETLELEDPLVLNSHITPLKFYETLYMKNQYERDFLLVIDEAEMVFENSKMKTMLKILCDTKEEKTLSYITSSPALKDIDQEFTTKAKVIILINTLNPDDPQIKAIMSRGHLLYFTPSDQEIYNHMKTFAEDKEILNFIKGFAPFTRNLDLRTYVKAEESKLSGLDWKREIVNETGIDASLLEIKKLLDKKNLTDEQRLKQWSSSRSTYFRYKRLFLSKTEDTVS